ncbi:hypothetical protein [Nocardioides sp.]|uniref:hypothetical protein n=1 Tax=Nocardioides sp. TaxID=35761 RepID=UPI0035173039
MTPGLDAALALVLRDLAVTGVPQPRIEATSWQDAVPAESAWLIDADGSGTGVWWDPSAPDAEALSHLADQVQDWAVEELAHHGLPTNWPVCPAHPANHPRHAVVRDGVAAWACPQGAADTTTPIGQLTTSG